jgi:hypothetical protein
MHAPGMPRSARSLRKVDLQIRGVPLELRRRLGQRAANKGVSMSRYVIDVLSEEIALPRSMDEWFTEVEALLGPARDDRGPAPSETLRRMRDAEDTH